MIWDPRSTTGAAAEVLEGNGKGDRRSIGYNRNVLPVGMDSPSSITPG